MFQHSTTTGYAPWANGAVEAIHKFHRNATVSFIDEDPRLWDEYFDLFTLTYNSAFSSAIGTSPGKAMFGRELMTPGSLPPTEQADMKYLDYPDRVSFILSRIQNKILDYKRNKLMKKNEILVKTTQFEVGQQVLHYVPRTTSDD